MKQALKDKNQNVFYEVEYWSDKNIIYSNWKGDFLDVDEVKEGALLGLEKIKEYKTSIFLNDNRELRGSWDGANEWIANEWIPNAIAAGLKKFAHIVPEDIYAQLSADFMKDNSEEVKDAFQMRIFEDEAKAIAWLLKDVPASVTN